MRGRGGGNEGIKPPCFLEHRERRGGGDYPDGGQPRRKAQERRGKKTEGQLASVHLLRRREKKKKGEHGLDSLSDWGGEEG